MTRDRLKYAACQSCDFLNGSPESAIARLAIDEALDRWPNSLATVCEAAGYTADLRKWEKQLRKIREREEDRLYREVRAATLAKVQENPQAYGFVGIIGIVMLLWQIGSIVWPIVRWLMSRRYEGHDHEIQQAVGAIG